MNTEERCDQENILTVSRRKILTAGGALADHVRREAVKCADELKRAD